MKDTAENLTALANALERSEPNSVEDYFVLSASQRAWIVKALRYKANAMRVAEDESLAAHIKAAFEV